MTAKNSPLEHDESWGVDYWAALERLARDVGASAEELHVGIQRRIASTLATAQCLTLAEIEALSGGALSSKRAGHVETCGFCTGLIRLLSAADSSTGRFGHAAGPSAPPRNP